MQHYLGHEAGNHGHFRWEKLLPVSRTIFLDVMYLGLLAKLAKQTHVQHHPLLVQSLEQIILIGHLVSLIKQNCN